MNIAWQHFTPWSALAGGALIGLAAALLVVCVLWRFDRYRPPKASLPEHFVDLHQIPRPRSALQ